MVAGLFSGAPGRLSVSYASASRTGGRERNEDSVLAIERDGGYCFVVADGLGGHGLGDEASKMLVEAFAREFAGAADNREFLARAFDAAQECILSSQEARGLNNQMKTTAVALSIIGGKCAWGHVGDSRLYRFRRGAPIGRTLDHSVPQVLAQSGEISEREIATHPDRALLLRAVGDRWSGPQYEISKETRLHRHTGFLLCSDGLWERVPAEGLAPPPGADAEAWLAAALGEAESAGQGAGDMDNYSAVVVIVE